MRTCERSHASGEGVRLPCQFSTTHIIGAVGDVLKTNRFNVEVKEYNQAKLKILLKYNPDTDFCLTTVLEKLKTRITQPRITRQNLHTIIDEMFESGWMDIEQEFTAGASYPDHCAQYYCLPSQKNKKDL